MIVSWVEPWNGGQTCRGEVVGFIHNQTTRAVIKKDRKLVSIAISELAVCPDYRDVDAGRAILDTNGRLKWI